MQVNYLTDKGGFTARKDGRFEVHLEKIKSALRDLDHDLLTIEAAGDYTRAKRMLDELGVIRPEMQKALNNLSDIPVDIEPIFATANELSEKQSAGPLKAGPKRCRSWYQPSPLTSICRCKERTPPPPSETRSPA